MCSLKFCVMATLAEPILTILGDSVQPKQSQSHPIMAAIIIAANTKVIWVMHQSEINMYTAEKSMGPLLKEQITFSVDAPAFKKC